MNRNLLESIIIWFGVILATFFFLFPAWNIIWGALKTPAQFASTAIFEPTLNITTEPFIFAWSKLYSPFLVSFQIALITTAMAVIVGILGGYSFRKANFKGAGLLFSLVVFGLYIPGVTKLIPSMRVLQMINLYDTTIGVGLILGSIQLPIATILFKQFFAQIPESYFEVASLSGANHLDMLLKIVLPLSKTPIITVSVLSFAVGWNSLLYPLVLTSGAASTRPVAITVSNLRTAAQRQGTYNHMLAGGILAALPVVIVYLIFQRYVTGGFRGLGKGQK